VAPGRSWSRASASRIMARPTRSFTEPPGFLASSLARSVASGAIRLSRTRGVLPTVSSTLSWIGIAAEYRDGPGHDPGSRAGFRCLDRDAPGSGRGAPSDPEAAHRQVGD